MFFKNYKRFEQDERIAVVESIHDIPRCGRMFSRVNGVLCPYDPFTQTEEAEIADYVRANYNDLKGGIDNLGDVRPGLFYKKTSRNILPQPLLRTFGELEQVFKRATGTKAMAELRADSRVPSWAHQHATTLTYTFKGVGTIGYRMDGQSYEIPDKHIFIFDKEIPHSASQSLPKLTILVG